MSYYEQFHKNVKGLAKSSDSTILKELQLLRDNPLISDNEKQVIGKYLMRYMPKKKALKFGEAVVAATAQQPTAPIAPTAPTQAQQPTQGTIPVNYGQTAQVVAQAQQAMQGLLSLSNQANQNAARQNVTGFGRRR